MSLADFSLDALGAAAPGALPLPSSQGSLRSHPFSTTGPKREQLRRYDRLPCVVCTPEGPSPAKDCELGDLWTLALNGNPQVVYHSEWCSADPYRRGIALSRLCESLRAMGDQLCSDNAKAIVQPAVLEKAKEEWNTLQPHVVALDRGKASANQRVTLGSLSSTQAVPAARRDEDQVTAATVVHAWLTKPSSPLRTVLAVLSMGGAFYVASVHEKVGRAAVAADGGNLSEADFQAAVARKNGGREAGCAAAASSGGGGVDAMRSALLS